ncbi:alpha/beta hydrolase [Actinoplanes sp. NPDC051861]|uniref:alpha/beta hydrolase n=1 Tax=Actinoplanes sp. NPDC051861 TaxID=3155170 RepID=UPI0034489148
MASWQMSVVAGFTRLVYRRRFVTEAAGHRTLARPKGSAAPPSFLTKRFEVTRENVWGFDVYRVRSGAGADRPVVVYLHGGAYTSEIVRQHWSLIGHIAGHTGCDVHVPIYGLAPRHHGLEALEFVTKAIRDLGRPVYLAGDSAGGGLALLAAQASENVVGMTLIAPWLDLTMSNPGIDAIEPHDPWLARPGLRPIADAWTGGLALDDPRLSPIYGNLSGLPPMQVLVGTRDITMADCRTLREKIPGMTYVEVPGALHDYPLLPVPEARAGRRAIVEHIRSLVRE